MTGIAKIDASSGLAAFAYPDDHPVIARWIRPEAGFIHRLQQAMQARGAHPARTLVLLPFAQLRPLAARMWTRVFGDGFAPRFETTMNWCQSAGAFHAGPIDIRLDATWDLLTAHKLLEQAGLGEQKASLAGLLVQTAHQLAPLAAASAPADRPQWAAQARSAALQGMTGTALQWEVAVARVAVEWAALSAYASDLLFTPDACAGMECLVMVQGIADDPLAKGLAQAWGDGLALLPLDLPEADEPAAAPKPHLHACLDAEDEAKRCAAQALAHIADGRFPLALVSSDRVLTRRVRALLDGAGVAIRDETGWKLSTSHAGAGVMGLLQASVWSATSDLVLSWLKHTPDSFAAAGNALEVLLRKEQIRDWRQVAASLAVQKKVVVAALVQAVENCRAGFKGLHTLGQWLGRLRAALQACGMWESLLADEAGRTLVETLGLQAGSAELEALLSESLWSQGRMDLSEFTRWVSDTLEASSFKPAFPENEQVVILPMSQMLGRPFAAVLLAGCDEVRLLPSPEPAGLWSEAQRTALGLPGRSALQAQTAMAWRAALRLPVCEVFWRQSDEGGESLLPSPLVQQLQAESVGSAAGADARMLRSVALEPTRPPQPNGALLPVTSLTQGAYDDLRHCPYRFFALRQLGLQPLDELESEVDKRDFGVWLHAVLDHFHAALAGQPNTALPVRLQLLDASALEATRNMALPEGEFLPFAAAWPAVRDGYLKWLAEHESETRAVFQSGEAEQRQALGTLTIKGRVDRMDRLPDGGVMVLDYKTESLDKTRTRTKDPLEDTQMAFYAALLPHDTLRGAYVNISEKQTTLLEQTDLVDARDALIEGMLDDVQRVAAGAPLPALGQGSVCDYCQARGLCRRDFWTTAKGSTP